MTPPKGEVGDGSALKKERGDEEKSSAEVSEKEATDTQSGGSTSGNESEHAWQAVWDATSHRWYFWNAKTQETTWNNPLEDVRKVARDEGEASASIALSTSAAVSIDAQLTDDEVAKRCGIDPDLAYLDPSTYASEIQQARASMTGTVPAPSTTNGRTSYRAAGAFDSRTGKFVPLQQTGHGGLHDPSRLGHANQADRQMSAFFDVEAHNERRIDEHREALRKRAVERLAEDKNGSHKRQRDDHKAAPTRKELRMYKERAKEKKASKHAWLRE